MDQKMYYNPSEILNITSQKGIAKIQNPIWKQILLGILAGAFIAFAAEGSNMAAYGLFLKPETYGLGKFVAGAIFPIGLMLVLIAGADLFTGNNLISVALFEKKVSIKDLLQNWFFVYFGNFLGSLLIVFFIIKSGQLHSGENLLGGVSLKIAYGKISLGFIDALILGIMCNWLVCLAVWLCYGAKDMIGKIFGIFFPILLFITSGFEHSIANMYYIPIGILAKSFPEFVQASHLTENQLLSLNWSSFITNNLIPVTIGNIIGGSFFVGAIYWFCYKKRSK